MNSVRSLKAFIARNGGGEPFRPRPGVVVVGSGKGGVGTSLVAALLALSAARRGESVLLVDGDETVGSLHLMFGLQDPGPGLGALRGGHTTPEQLVRVVAPGLALLPGGGGATDSTLALATAERRAFFRRVTSLYERYGLVVVDGGSRLESVMAACAAGVERLVAVTAPGRISLASSYALFKVASSRFESLPVELLINGVSEGDGRSLHAVVRQATQSFLGTDVRFGGTIPRDAELQEGLETGLALQDLVMHSPAAAAAEAIVDRVLLEGEVHAGGDPLVRPLLPLR